MELDRNTFCSMLESKQIPANILIIMYDNDEIRWYGRRINNRIYIKFPYQTLPANFKDLFESLSDGSDYRLGSVRSSYSNHSKFKFKLVSLYKRIARTKPL